MSPIKTKGTAERTNQCMHVRPFIRNASPSHAARIRDGLRANRTSASKRSGIQPEKT